MPMKSYVNRKNSDSGTMRRSDRRHHGRFVGPVTCLVRLDQHQHQPGYNWRC